MRFNLSNLKALCVIKGLHVATMTWESIPLKASNIHLPCSRALIEVHVDADRNGRRRPRPFLVGRSDSASVKRKWRQLSHQWPAVSQFASLLSLIYSLGAGRILKGGKSNSVRGPDLSLPFVSLMQQPLSSVRKFIRSHELGKKRMSDYV